MTDQGTQSSQLDQQTAAAGLGAGTAGGFAGGAVGTTVGMAVGGVLSFIVGLIIGLQWGGGERLRQRPDAQVRRVSMRRDQSSEAQAATPAGATASMAGGTASGW